MTKRVVVGRIVSFAELRGEDDPANYVVVSDLPDLSTPQIEIAAAYAEIKLRSLLGDQEWAMEIQDQILEGNNPFGFFEEYRITAEDILDDLID